MEAFVWTAVVRADLIPYCALGIGVLVVCLRFRTISPMGDAG